ncbi:hypothetical protein CEUSTIGMA_g13210.t1 [Chlamydomonas eustigma]|uniref:Methylcrotonoyl-CoA carboxylase subunit alpha, mitochondrial n=1 Tax=Chlamydomonas eustigma TaxID=1157962 RepID=A0A250XRW5_9CHLO|nr:hypothetical protein CEUSTIGMA_g13210.t1 [Chlamydomonas eustigma]|eukprot:GAX85795.1 hypothetical protein CEUSTIGMA_g13210.t1 [Chlamydomonas eustigma]
MLIAGRFQLGFSTLPSICTKFVTYRSFSELQSIPDLGRIHKLVVANRGEIACRVLTTAKRLGVPTVALYSEADRGSKHVRLADEAFCIGGAPAKESYLRSDTILEVCSRAGGRSIHPGYGFLSENADFSAACKEAGVAFVGPGAEAIRSMGNKSEAKGIMSYAGVPVVPGYHGHDQSEERLLHEAQLIGFPLLVKAVSGGGGKGMKLAHNLSEVPEALASAKREAASSFGDDRVLLERYILRPRHVEVQVVCDALGNGVYVFDRDCSLQRRHQKVIEEAPAPGLSQEFHDLIGNAAVRAAKAAGYVNAGTVEFIVDMGPGSGQPFYFMEMNTRLQVEHPISEEISGVDLVEWQLRVAAGLPLPLTQEALGKPHGHAFEARLYAESPRRGFLPGAGIVSRWKLPTASRIFQPLRREERMVAGSYQQLPHRDPCSTQESGLPGRHTPCTQASSGEDPGASSSASRFRIQDQGRVRVRVDSGVEEGDTVGTFYDPMIAKIVCWGPDRLSALEGLRGALMEAQVAGLPVNLEFLKQITVHPKFKSAEDLTTAFIKENHDVLMPPQRLSEVDVAVAAVARHLLEIADCHAAFGGAAIDAWRSPLSLNGAWSLADSKRLWGHAYKEYHAMSCAEGEAVSSLGEALEDQNVSVRLKLISMNTFEVIRLKEVQQIVQPVSALSSLSSMPNHTSAHLRLEHVHLDQQSGRFSAEIQGRKVHADVVLQRSGHMQVLCIWMGERALELRWERLKQDKGFSISTNMSCKESSVSSPMPGRLVKIAVEEGQRVKVGATMFVLEAMKMEHLILASSEGLITGLHITVGEQVSEGQILAILHS